MSKIKMIGLLDIKGNESVRRVYDPSGISPTLTTSAGGNRQPKIIVGGDELIIDDTQGFDGVRVYKDFSPTLRAQRSGLKTLGGDGLKKVTVNDLFCGCGGMGLGFKQAGFEIAGAWDFDKYAVESYKHNVGDHVVQANILDMTHDDMPYADVWTFGAPCQAFSVAGKQLGMTFKCPSCKHEETFEGELIIDRQTFCSKCGTLSEPKDIRGIMFFEVMRLLKETEEKPPIIMLENVKGVSKFLDVIAYEYEKRGYKLYKTLYNSKYWGVPQNRERYFVVGVHESIEKEFEFPMQQDKYIPRLSTILESEVDEKYYIDPEKTEKLVSQVIGKMEHHKLIDDQGRNKQHKLLDVSPTIKAEEHGNNKKVVLQVKEATKKGYAEATIGDSINLSHPNSKTRRGRVGKQVAQTLLTGQEQVVVEQVAANVLEIAKQTRPNDELGVSINSNGNIRPHRMDQRKSGLSELNVAYEGNEGFTCTASHANKIYGESTNYRIRKLSPREYARLQGFPESFEIVVSNSQAYKQFGNAVTVNVSRAIAERIRMFLLSL